MRTKKMHPVAQYREDNDFLKQNAGFLFKYKELILGHAWFPYVPIPLDIPGIRPVPLGALLELAGNSSEEFCLLCENATWWEPIIMDGIPDKLAVITDPEIDIESPSSLFLSLKERAEAQLDVIRNRVRALSELCAQYNHADAVPPKADLREVVFSLERAGNLAYLTDEQVERLRSLLCTFKVYDSLEEMENSLVDVFLESIISDCRDGASVTFRPEYFQYAWSQIDYSYHFTAHYAKDRNVCIFSEKADIINSIWYMRRAQEKYLKTLYVSRFEAIFNAVEKAIKGDPDLEIENFNPETHSFTLANRVSRDLPALTLWEAIDGENNLEKDIWWLRLVLDDGPEDLAIDLIRKDEERRRRENELAQRQRAKILIPAHADLLERIIDGAASDEDLDQCVKLCDQIEWDQQEVENE